MKKEHFYRPLGQTSRWKFDIVHWTCVIVITAVTALFIVGSAPHIVFLRVLSMPGPAILYSMGGAFCDHNVELVWAQGSFPHQLYSKRRRGVSWSLLFHRRCCCSQCQRRPALPRGSGCAIRGECTIQTDDLGAVFILVHPPDCSCNTSYRHCLHTQFPATVAYGICEFIPFPLQTYASSLQ